MKNDNKKKPEVNEEVVENINENVDSTETNPKAENVEGGEKSVSLDFIKDKETREKVEEVADKAKEVADEAVDKVKELYNDAAPKVEAAYDAVTPYANSAWEKMKQLGKDAYASKYFWMVVVNFILALTAVYSYQYWYDALKAQSATHFWGNLGILGVMIAALFTAKTFYIKGTLNTLRKISLLGGAFVLIIALTTIVLDTWSDLMYPLDAIIFVGITYYMFTLAIDTIKAEGIMVLATISALPIVAGKILTNMEWSTVLEFSKLSVFIILFVGGTWPALRASWHRIFGTNKDGSGESFGDEGDGDGDTGDE